MNGLNSATSNSQVWNALFKILAVCISLHIMILPLGNRIIKIAFCCVEILIFLLIAGYKLICFPVIVADFGMLAIVSFIMVFNCILYGTGIGFDLLVSMLCVFAFLLSVMSCDMIFIDESTLRFLRKNFIFLACICALYAVMPFSHQYQGRSISSLTLGFTNPNLTGIYLFLIYSMLLILCPERKKHIFFVLQIVLLYLIYLTKSRASLIAAGFITILGWMARNKMPKPLVLGICLVPFVYVFLHQWLHETGYQITFIGKELFSGREYVYADYLRKINSFRELLLGSFERDIFANAHNAPLAVFTSIGLLGTGAMYFILIDTLMRITGKAKERIQRIAICALLACFIQSTNEAFLFLGEFPGAIFIFMFYVLACNCGCDIKKDQAI